MKKIRFYILAAIFSFSLTATASGGETAKSTEPGDRGKQIESRVHEIWKMDFKEMDQLEKQVLKKELKSFKKEIKKTDGLDDKVSISIGAIIIIILILIII